MSNIEFNISNKYNSSDSAVILEGDSSQTLQTIPNDTVQLIITSPPYNIGKEYEESVSLEKYLNNIDPILKEISRILHPQGSICWQVGNYVNDGEVFPLDIYYYFIFKKLGFKLRNRIIWHFDHGLHAKKRLSGRYETMLWFTKSDSYVFNLDDIRIPSKYPGKKHYKPGPNYGKLSGNPLGKNPSDIWKIISQEWEDGLWCIPNVKSNHPEKTLHPCQFPIELVERCILALTNKDDIVLDPFTGTGTSMLAALKQDRKCVGCEKDLDYIDIAKHRIKQFINNELPYRPLGKPIHNPKT